MLHGHIAAVFNPLAVVMPAAGGTGAVFECTPSAISDNFGKAPTKPLRVAQGMDMSPTSSLFRMLCGAAIAYGLTEGGYSSEQISITPLGKRIVAPTIDGDDLAARCEATLRPRVLRDFLTRYNGSKLPSAIIGRNVLEELGTPTDKTETVYNLIVDSARSVGFLREVKGQTYVDLDATAAAAATQQVDNTSDSAVEDEEITGGNGLSIVPPHSTFETKIQSCLHYAWA